MNPLCIWTQWRLSGVQEGYRASRRVRRHADRCPRCAAFHAGLRTWVDALQPGARRPAPLAPGIQDGILGAVREADIAGSEPRDSSRPLSFLPIPRFAVAAIALVLLLAALSTPVATTRMRRTRAVRHLSRRGAEWAHVMTHVPGSIELPMALENDRFAEDITRALRFLADGLPLLGAMESAARDETLLR